jgi:hypothetical protein
MMGKADSTFMANTRHGVIPDKFDKMELIESPSPRIDKSWGFARPNFQPNDTRQNGSDHTSTQMI